MVIESVHANTKTSTQPDTAHEREIEQWAKTLGIPPARLKQAVSAVGITPRRIREYLRNKQ